MLALIISGLLGKTGSADGNQVQNEQAAVKEPEETKSQVSGKATEEAIAAPPEQGVKRKTDDSQDSQTNQKSLQLKS